MYNCTYAVFLHFPVEDGHDVRVEVVAKVELQSVSAQMNEIMHWVFFHLGKSDNDCAPRPNVRLVHAGEGRPRPCPPEVGRQQHLGFPSGLVREFGAI